MLEILQFIFSSFWVFIGVCILLSILCETLCQICKHAMELGPFTYGGLKREAIRKIIFKDIVYNDKFEPKNNLIKEKICIVNETISIVKNK